MKRSRIPVAFSLALVAASATLQGQTSAADAPETAADLAFFETEVRPLFVKHCHECHSAAAAEIRSGLRLDSRAAILAGGDGGEIVVVGRPERSRLVEVLSSRDPDVQMPPRSHGGPLPREAVAAIEEWIRHGLAMPEGPPPDVADRAAAAATHWAFQPVRDHAAPAVANDAWPRTDVDRFLLAKLDAAGLAPVADARPAALLRRVHIDLTGLPPEPEEVAEFLADPSRVRFLATVDRLLASPRFGERWGRHWLDVARYAESSGKETDFAYPHAWRYRDYVVRAFNDDMPFDQFAIEQIAGDFFEARDDRERAELLVATGFLAIGPKSHAERNRLQFEMDVVDEQIDAVTQAFLGLTVACARCHDHKYDPVSQRDYYALAGIFRSTDTRYGTIRVIQNVNPGDLVELPRSAGQPDGVRPLDARTREFLESQLDRLADQFAGMAADGRRPDPGQAIRNRTQVSTLTSRLEGFTADGTPKQFAMAALDRRVPRDSPLFLRGEVEKPGVTVPRGLPALAGGGTIPAAESGRLELARWIAAADNPLTPRVIVNRVWLHLFGRGLVATPDNFGIAGEPPSHPELLDHLAARFARNGWRIKPLIRELVASRGYGLSTRHDDKAFDADPDNVLRWRMTPARLDAEAIRDGILFTAGTLDLAPPEGSTVENFGEGLAAGRLIGQGRPFDETVFTRAIYLPALRGTPLEPLALFDMPSPAVVTGQRPETTVPAQSLYLLNDGFVIRQAEEAAAWLAEEEPDVRRRAERAWLRFFGRRPSAAEVDAALAFVRLRGETSAAWAELCQSLWASHEFLARN
ncbi:MAG: PSD1 and planctomycete cytochrome C domain-containing protein [Planctomycetaceae bacterium]